MPDSWPRHENYIPMCLAHFVPQPCMTCASEARGEVQSSTTAFPWQPPVERAYETPLVFDGWEGYPDPVSVLGEFDGVSDPVAFYSPSDIDDMSAALPNQGSSAVERPRVGEVNDVTPDPPETAQSAEPPDAGQDTHNTSERLSEPPVDTVALGAADATPEPSLPPYDSPAPCDGDLAPGRELLQFLKDSVDLDDARRSLADLWNGGDATQALLAYALEAESKIPRCLFCGMEYPGSPCIRCDRVQPADAYMVTDYGEANRKDRRGDGLDGDEFITHGFLKAHGVVGSRNDMPANAALFLTPSEHKRLSRVQRARKLHDPEHLATITLSRLIDENLRCMIEARLPPERIAAVYAYALEQVPYLVDRGVRY